MRSVADRTSAQRKEGHAQRYDRPPQGRVKPLRPQFTYSPRVAFDDLTKKQKSALREASRLAHQRDESMGLEDRDVYYLGVAAADLPLIIGGAVSAGLLSVDEVGEPARDLVCDIAAKLREIREAIDAAPPPVEDPYDPSAIVSVSRIVVEIDLLSEGTALFLNRETGEVTVQAEDELFDDEQLNEDEEEGDEGDDGAEAESRAEDDDRTWICLLLSHDMDDFGTMRRFAVRVAGPAARKDLSEALSGRGAYRRFRETIHRRGLTGEWEAYLVEKRADHIRFILEQKGIAFRR